MVAYNHGAGVTPVEIFEQLSHGSLLFSGTRVGGLTADVEPTLIADANRVGVMVLAVGTDHPFRPSGLDCSVTTDHVVVADAEVKTSLAMPCVDLRCRARLPGPHCRTVKDNQRNDSHKLLQLCTKKVDTMAVMTVKIKFAILLIVVRFIKSFIFIVYFGRVNPAEGVRGLAPLKLSPLCQRAHRPRP